MLSWDDSHVSDRPKIFGLESGISFENSMNFRLILLIFKWAISSPRCLQKWSRQSTDQSNKQSVTHPINYSKISWHTMVKCNPFPCHLDWSNRPNYLVTFSLIWKQCQYSGIRTKQTEVQNMIPLAMAYSPGLFSSFFSTCLPVGQMFTYVLWLWIRLKYRVAIIKHSPISVQWAWQIPWVWVLGRRGEWDNRDFSRISMSISHQLCHMPHLGVLQGVEYPKKKQNEYKFPYSTCEIQYATAWRSN